MANQEPLLRNVTALLANIFDIFYCEDYLNGKREVQIALYGVHEIPILKNRKNQVLEML
jgi:hypothetical protein